MSKKLKFILLVLAAVAAGSVFLFNFKPADGPLNEPADELVDELIEKHEEELAYPDLDRPINMTANLFSDTQKEELKKKINEVADYLKADPSLADHWIELGGLRQTIGDYEGAALYWEYAARLRPGNYIPFNNLGFLYRSYLKDFQKSEANFLKATVVEPKLIAVFRELSDLYRYSYPEKSGQADDILLEGLQKNPGNFELLVYLAQYYRDVGDKVNGKKYFEEALKVRPNEPSVLRELQKLSQ